MKLFISTFLLLSSVSAFALPGMNTKEAVRLELWFYGLDTPSEIPEAARKKPTNKVLPLELEQALLKF